MCPQTVNPTLHESSVTRLRFECSDVIEIHKQITFYFYTWLPYNKPMKCQYLENRTDRKFTHFSIFFCSNRATATNFGSPEGPIASPTHSNIYAGSAITKFSFMWPKSSSKSEFCKNHRYEATFEHLISNFLLQVYVCRPST